MAEVQKVTAVLPCRWQEMNHLSPGSAVARSRSRELEPKTKPKYSDVECGCVSD